MNDKGPQRPRKRIKIQLASLAGHAARGVAYAAGSTAFGMLILWWQQH